MSGYTPYYPSGWQDSPSTATDLDAAALNHMESGIGAATDAAAAAQAAADAAATPDQVTAAVAAETTRAETAEAGLAPLASPALTGTPTAPTAEAGTDTTQVATTAFVAAAVPEVPVASVFGRTGAVVAASGDYTAADVGAATAADITAAVTALDLGTASKAATADFDAAGAAAAAQSAAEAASVPLSQAGAASGVATLDASGQVPASQLGNVAAWLPQDNGLLAANFDPAAAGSSKGMAAGTVYIQRIPVRQPVTVSSILFAVSGSGAGASSGTFAGLYDSGGHLLGQSVDLGTLTNGLITAALTSPVELPAGWVWAAYLGNLASTQPSLVSSSSFGYAINAGLSAAVKRSGRAVAAVTALPSSFDPSDYGTTDNFGVWMGLA